MMVNNVQQNLSRPTPITCQRNGISKSVKIAHVNVENIIVHRDTFLNFFYDTSYDIIAVSETFLKPEIVSLQFQLNGYSLIRHDRENKEGGGVAIYLRNIFNYKMIASSQTVYCKKPEFIVLEVSAGWKLLVCVVYRPPKAGYIAEFFDILANLLPLYDNVVIVGDFNIDLSSDRIFYDKTEYLNLIKNLNLNILSLKPTFHLPLSDTCLDHILCKDLLRVIKHGQLSVSGLSYHDLIYVELNLKLKPEVKKDFITIRDFKNINVNKLKEECLSIEWGDLYNKELIDDKVNILCNKLLGLYDKYIPERIIYTKKNPCPWIDSNIKTYIRERDLLYKRYLRTKDPNVWERYRVLRNNVKRILRDARNKHFQHCFQTNLSSKSLWKVVKQQGVGKGSKTLSDPVVQLNELNSFFCGVSSAINLDLIEYYNNLVDNQNVNFNFREVDNDSIFRAISYISSNALGDDGISLKFIKLIFEEIKYVLCHIYNYSLMNSVYPKQWKHSLILPLKKIPNPSSCNNYRAINILCVLGKVLDKLVYNQICKFVCDQNFLCKYQSGYRPNFSTQTALVRVVDDVRRAMDNRQVTVLLLLDFSRAFDCVNHALLLAILRSFNVSDNAVQWFSSYLTERMQRVKSGSGLYSEWKHNPVGVPQGSTLSSLLFSLYINKICDNLSFCKFMLYADDLQLYVHCNVNDLNNAVKNLNSDLNVLMQWCSDHGLSLNVAKCKPIIIGTSRILNTLNLDSVESVVINNVVLPYEDTVLNLGLRINKTLSWSEQVNYIHKRVFQCLYQFKRLCFNPPLEIRKLLVQSLVFPLFDYASAVFCDLSSTLVEKLQKAQNSCIRFIFRLRYDEHVTMYYKNLNWLKIKERLEYNMLSLAFKITNKKEPLYLFENYKTMTNIHSKETRHGKKMLQFPLHKTVIYNKSFHIQSIRLLNSLDDRLRKCKNVKEFNTRIKADLLNRYDLAQ